VNYAGLREEELRVSCNISTAFSRRNARNTPNTPEQQTVFLSN